MVLHLWLETLCYNRAGDTDETDSREGVRWRNQVINKPNQRIGAKSNAHVGREFELLAKEYFFGQGIELSRNLEVAIGVNGYKKPHAFDLGSNDSKILVECKSHRWTAPNENVPSAKLAVWNEAMYYFLLAPSEYRKIMFVLRDYSAKHGKTLARYYFDTYKHLIPSGVELLEFNETTKQVVHML